MTPINWLSDPDVRRGFAIAASLALTPIVMRALGNLAPPRQISAGAANDLKSRYSKIEGWSQVVAIISIWISLLVWFRLGGRNSYWLLAFGLGWMCITPMLFVAAISALRKDVSWTEFWRHHELKHHVDLRAFTVAYGTACVLGLVATAKLLFVR